MRLALKRRKAPSPWMARASLRPAASSLILTVGLTPIGAAELETALAEGGAWLPPVAIAGVYAVFGAVTIAALRWVASSPRVLAPIG